MEEEKKPRNEKNKTAGKEKPQSRCDDCEFYVYDEEYEEYVCNMSLDEDEMAEYLQFHTGRCPYYRPFDEYKVVRHQN